MKFVVAIPLFLAAFAAAEYPVPHNDHNNDYGYYPPPVPTKSPLPVPTKSPLPVPTNGTAPVHTNGTIPVHTNGTAPVHTNGTAHGIDKLPKCSIPCFANAVKHATNCTMFDLPCVCSQKVQVAKAGRDCVIKKCGLIVASREVLPAGRAMCDEVVTEN